MSYLLPHLHSGWAVDQAILAEEERAVVIRFGHDWDETCMQVCIFASRLRILLLSSAFCYFFSGCVPLVVGVAWIFMQSFFFVWMEGLVFYKSSFSCMWGSIEGEWLVGVCIGLLRIRCYMRLVL